MSIQPLCRHPPSAKPPIRHGPGRTEVGTLEELKDWDWSSVITAAQATWNRTLERIVGMDKNGWEW